MTPLQSAIENLYKTFAKYTTEGIHHCDCGCIDEEDVRKLYSKSLRELEVGDLVSYHGSALYTWGDVEHYKHYLPRICELISTQRKFVFVDFGEVHTKLEAALWWEWGRDEISALKEFVWQDWAKLVNSRKNEITERELEDYGKFFALTKLIGAWDFQNSDAALYNFVNFFYSNGNQLLNGGWKINNKKYEDELIPFFCNQKLVNKLELAFFAQEKKDTEYAEKISIILQMIEQEIKIGR